MIMRLTDEAAGYISGTWALAEDPPHNLAAIGGYIDGNVEKPIGDGSMITFDNFTVTYPCFGDFYGAMLDGTIDSNLTIKSNFSIDPCGLGTISVEFTVSNDSAL
jgi:hypothetical protein